MWPSIVPAVDKYFPSVQVAQTYASTSKPEFPLQDMQVVFVGPIQV